MRKFLLRKNTYILCLLIITSLFISPVCNAADLPQPIIRSDLLNKLGLAIPETIDEWEIVLEQFKKHNLCKSPLSFDVTVLNSSNSFISAFGISRDFYLDNGKVVYGPVENSCKDLLTTFSRWYRNGLIDKEFLVLKNAQILNKVNKGDVGAFIGTESDMENSRTALKALDAGYELISVKNPGMNKADVPDIIMPVLTLTEKENEEVDRIMKDVNTYTLEYFARFVMGVASLDSFDKYVETVKSLGIGRVIEIKQAALSRCCNGSGADTINIIVNDSPITMDTYPIIVNGRPLVPVRFVIEALGGSVEWDQQDRSVTAQLENKKIVFKIGSNDVLVNSEHKTLETSAILLNDRTYIPFEFVSALGLEVDWDENTKSILVR